MKKTRLYAFAPLVVYLLTGILGVASMWPPEVPQCRKAYAATDYPLSDFCYIARINVKNITGGTLTNYLAAVEVPSATLVSDQFMGPNAFDLFLGDSASDERALMVQDVEANPARWWFQIPSILAGQTIEYTIYLGAPLAHRNNGFVFNGDAATWVTTADHADFDITDNLRMTAWAETTVAHATDAWFLSHYNTAGVDGYRLGTIDIVGVKYVRAQVDGSTCDAVWTGENQRIDATFQNPNLRVYLDEVLQNTCNTGLASISTVTDAFESGVSATGTGAYTGQVTRVLLMDNIDTTPVIQLDLGMEAHNKDGDNIVETINADPAFTGTIGDSSAGNHDATYHIQSCQAGCLIVTIGPITPQYTFSNPSTGFLGSRNLNTIIGTPVANPGSVVTIPTGGDNIPVIGPLLGDAIEETGESRQGIWMIPIGLIAIFFMTVVTRLTKFPSLGLTMPGVVFLGGAVLGLVSPWLAIIWAFVGAGWWGIARVGR